MLKKLPTNLAGMEAVKAPGATCEGGYGLGNSKKDDYCVADVIGQVLGTFWAAQPKTHFSAVRIQWGIPKSNLAGMEANKNAPHTHECGYGPGSPKKDDYCVADVIGQVLKPWWPSLQKNIFLQ